MFYESSKYLEFYIFKNLLSEHAWSLQHFKKKLAPCANPEDFQGWGGGQRDHCVCRGGGWGLAQSLFLPILLQEYLISLNPYFIIRNINLCSVFERCFSDELVQV